MKVHELKPCPFCGGEAKVIDKTNLEYKYRYWFVRCNRCGAESGWSENKHQAIEAWNRRTDDGKTEIAAE